MRVHKESSRFSFYSLTRASGHFKSIECEKRFFFYKKLSYLFYLLYLDIEEETIFVFLGCLGSRLQTIREENKKIDLRR